MAELLLEAASLTAGYQGVPALHAFDLTVREGEVVTLLGPNGAGKTTALLALVGFVKPLDGRVAAFGHPVEHRRAHRQSRRGMRLVPDDRGLFPGLSGHAHLRLTRRGATDEQRDAVLRRFPALTTVLGRHAGLMSGGEQQMLALASALLARPRLLLVDELSLGLAPIVVRELLPALKEVARADGVGVVLVEQHVDLALEFSDRAIVLNHGHTVLQGPSAELLRDRRALESAYFGHAGSSPTGTQEEL